MSKLDELKGNSAVLVMHERALSILKDIGFLDFLKERAKPHIRGLGDNPQILATQAARSAGYFEAIDDLIDFKERFWRDHDGHPVQIPMDYSGLKTSVQQGYMTKEEADGIYAEYATRK